MIQYVTNVLVAHGMKWKQSELNLLHVGGDKNSLAHDAIVITEDNVAVRIPRAAQLFTLGAVLDQCGRMEGTVDEQIAKAKSFFLVCSFFEKPSYQVSCQVRALQT